TTRDMRISIEQNIQANPSKPDQGNALLCMTKAKKAVSLSDSAFLCVILLSGKGEEVPPRRTCCI
ncbi:MAG: hypothetical protein FWB88_12555, partial [Defluviitaleaceae bacterium]|nr:hypothetical protein [Defluviitaleaceae bacterium]MCL2240387.1 hypothetical protein [Defluviitaleaceae bacterium]